jgi:hypothetical protein
MKCVECDYGAAVVVRDFVAEDAFLDLPMCMDHLFALRQIVPDVFWLPLALS